MSRDNSQVEGFGFKPTESEHYFLVSIPSQARDVQISEHMSWDKEMWKGKVHAVKDENDERLRVILPRVKWNGISDAVSSEFNRRLKNMGYKKGSWKERGLTPVSRLFGKELVLLAWAIEDADPGRIPAAVTNWLGLSQEERWWLYTMTNAATGQAIRGKNIGWRAAVRFALCDNPIAPSKMEQKVGLIASLDDEGKSIDQEKKHQGNLLDF